MLLGILPFIQDPEEPHAVMARLMDGVPGGSYLAISHGANDIHVAAVAEASKPYNQHSAVSLNLRAKASVSRFFDGLELLEPGVVPLNQWRPGRAETSEPPLPAYAALGRKAG